jgi:hypothetical protein
LVIVAGTHPRLLADHAVAGHFLHLAVGIGDHPVTGEQARRHLAGIAQGDGVGENVAIVTGLRLIGDEACFDLHIDCVGRFFSHARIVRPAAVNGAARS